MTYEVMDCFKRIMKKNDNNPGRTISVGSYSDFVFLNDKGKILLGYMLENGKVRNESQSVTIYHGICKD